jgi:hypothetical protein
MIALLVSVGDYCTFLRMMKEYKNNPEAYSVQFQKEALEEVSEKHILEKPFVEGRGGDGSSIDGYARYGKAKKGRYYLCYIMIAIVLVVIAIIHSG